MDPKIDVFQVSFKMASLILIKPNSFLNAKRLLKESSNVVNNFLKSIMSKKWFRKFTPFFME